MKLSGKPDVQGIWKEPPALRFSVPEEDLHVKFLESYLNGAGDVLLLRYIVVEGRLNQTVHILLANAGADEWVLKLDRSCPMLRTAGVKLLIATLAAWFEARGMSKVSSTVEAYESRGRFYAVHPAQGSAATD